MDGDPAVEPQLDGFSRVLPLPYRVAMIIVLGVWAPSRFQPSTSRAGLITPTRRYLGMGSQPPLPLAHQN